MAPRYRKVSVRIHGDEKIRRLSRPTPNGFDCFMYLLTARESTDVPGLIPAGISALAESLRWDREGFLRAFAELEREGLAVADWDAGLVWIPKAILHNPPENPNQVKGWADTWDDVIPESPLKAQAWDALNAYFATRGEGFVQAFETFTKPSRNVRPNPPRNVGGTLAESGTGTGTGTGEKLAGASGAPPARSETRSSSSSTSSSTARAKNLTQRLTDVFASVMGAAYQHQGAKDADAVRWLAKATDDDSEIALRWHAGLTAKGWHHVATFAQLRGKWNDLAALVVRAPAESPPVACVLGCGREARADVAGEPVCWPHLEECASSPEVMASTDGTFAERRSQWLQRMRREGAGAAA
jgi:hypothetical protein